MLPPSAETTGFLRLPVDPDDLVAGDPPPSLHRHYPASSLLWGSPNLAGASVLSASWGRHLCLFPSHRRPQVPCESPDPGHASYTPDTAWPVSRCLPGSSRSRGATPVLVSSEAFRCVIGGSLALVSRIHTGRGHRRAF